MKTVIHKHRLLLAICSISVCCSNVMAEDNEDINVVKYIMDNYGYYISTSGSGNNTFHQLFFSYDEKEEFHNNVSNYKTTNRIHTSSKYPFYLGLAHQSNGTNFENFKFLNNNYSAFLETKDFGSIHYGEFRSPLENIAFPKSINAFLAGLKGSVGSDQLYRRMSKMSRPIDYMPDLYAGLHTASLNEGPIKLNGQQYLKGDSWSYQSPKLLNRFQLQYANGDSDKDTGTLASESYAVSYRFDGLYAALGYQDMSDDISLDNTLNDLQEDSLERVVLGYGMLDYQLGGLWQRTNYQNNQSEQTMMLNGRYYSDDGLVYTAQIGMVENLNHADKYVGSAGLYWQPLEGFPLGLFGVLTYSKQGGKDNSAISLGYYATFGGTE